MVNNQPIKKLLSLVVTLAFVTGQAQARVFPIPNPVSTKTTHWIEAVHIQPAVGEIEDLYVATPSNSQPSRVVIHIKDAHANYEAQSHIRDIMKDLHKNFSFGLMAVEGAFAKLDPRNIQYSSEKEDNLKMAEFLARNGKISGTDLFILSEDKAEAYGIENPEIYEENLNVFRKIMEADKERDHFVNYLERQIELVAPRLLNKRLLKFTRAWQELERRPSDLLGFIRVLTQEAKTSAGVDLADPRARLEWPQLTRIIRLKEIEPQLNPKTIEEEHKRLMAFLTGKGISPDLIRQLEPSMASNKKNDRDAIPSPSNEQNYSPRFLYEKLFDQASPKGFSFSDYPNESLYAQFLILQSEVDSQKLFKEIETLAERIFGVLAAQSDEKEVIAFLKRLETFKKAFSLELLRKQIPTYAADKGNLRPQKMLDRLEYFKKTARVTNHTEDMTSLVSTLDPLADEVERFYEIAQRRELYLVQNTLRLMREKGTDRIILVTGGFHSEGIKEKLEAQGVSYLEIAPKITQLDQGSHQYLDVMMNRAPAVLEFSQLAPRDITDTLYNGESFPVQVTKGRVIQFPVRRAPKVPEELAKAASLGKTNIEIIREIRALIDRDLRFELKPVLVLWNQLIARIVGTVPSEAGLDIQNRIVLRAPKTLRVELLNIVTRLRGRLDQIDNPAERQAIINRLSPKLDLADLEEKLRVAIALPQPSKVVSPLDIQAILRSGPEIERLIQVVKTITTGVTPTPTVDINDLIVSRTPDLLKPVLAEIVAKVQRQINEIQNPAERTALINRIPPGIDLEKLGQKLRVAIALPRPSQVVLPPDIQAILRPPGPEIGRLIQFIDAITTGVTPTTPTVDINDRVVSLTPDLLKPELAKIVTKVQRQINEIPNPAERTALINRIPPGIDLEKLGQKLRVAIVANKPTQTEILEPVKVKAVRDILNPVLQDAKVITEVAKKATAGVLPTDKTNINKAVSRLPEPLRRSFLEIINRVFNRLDRIDNPTERDGIISNLPPAFRPVGQERFRGVFLPGGPPPDQPPLSPESLKTIQALLQPEVPALRPLAEALKGITSGVTPARGDIHDVIIARTPPPVREELLNIVTALIGQLKQVPNPEQKEILLSQLPPKLDLLRLQQQLSGAIAAGKAPQIPLTSPQIEAIQKLVQPGVVEAGILVQVAKAITSGVPLTPGLDLNHVIVARIPQALRLLLLEIVARIQANNVPESLRELPQGVSLPEIARALNFAVASVREGEFRTALSKAPINIEFLLNLLNSLGKTPEAVVLNIPANLREEVLRAVNSAQVTELPNGVKVPELINALNFAVASVREEEFRTALSKAPINIEFLLNLLNGLGETPEAVVLNIPANLREEVLKVLNSAQVTELPNGVKVPELAKALELAVNLQSKVEGPVTFEEVNGALAQAPANTQPLVNLLNSLGETPEAIGLNIPANLREEVLKILTSAQVTELPNGVKVSELINTLNFAVTLAKKVELQTALEQASTNTGPLVNLLNSLGKTPEAIGLNIPANLREEVLRAVNSTQLTELPNGVKVPNLINTLNFAVTLQNPAPNVTGFVRLGAELLTAFESVNRALVQLPTVISVGPTAPSFQASLAQLTQAFTQTAQILAQIANSPNLEQPVREFFTGVSQTLQTEIQNISPANVSQSQETINRITGILESIRQPFQEIQKTVRPDHVQLFPLPGISQPNKSFVSVGPAENEVEKYAKAASLGLGSVSTVAELAGFPNVGFGPGVTLGIPVQRGVAVGIQATAEAVKSRLLSLVRKFLAEFLTINTTTPAFQVIVLGDALSPDLDQAKKQLLPAIVELQTKTKLFSRVLVTSGSVNQKTLDELRNLSRHGDVEGREIATRFAIVEVDRKAFEEGSLFGVISQILTFQKPEEPSSLLTVLSKLAPQADLKTPQDVFNNPVLRAVIIANEDVLVQNFDNVPAEALIHHSQPVGSKRFWKEAPYFLSQAAKLLTNILDPQKGEQSQFQINREKGFTNFLALPENLGQYLAVWAQAVRKLLAAA